MNDEQMAKALRDLIDETIAEIEDLKKSDRFSASEIKIEGPGDDLAGKPTNGELDAKKADDKDDDEEKKEEVEKGVLDEAEKAEKDDDDDKKEDKKEDKKIAQKEVDKHNEEKHGEPKDEDSAMKKSEESTEEVVEKSEETKVEETKVEESTEDNLQKSAEEAEELMKSYVDSRITPIEEKMEAILKAVQELADVPVERKSVPSDLQPLTKSTMDGPEPLNKSEVIHKMLELKKSGTSIPTDDITRAELGGPADLEQFVNKYKLTRD